MLTPMHISPVRHAAWLLAAVSLPAAAGTAGSPPSPIGMAGEVLSGGFVLQFLSGLGLVVLCILGLAWLMKRTGGLRASAQGNLRVVDGMALSARERIVLVEVGDTQVLLGIAPGRISALHVLGEKVDSPATRPEQPGFAARLREVMGREARS
jgi:flagellar protein FliO/FliZ